MDFIFIIGPSAVGKIHCNKNCHKHYNGVYLEQNMVPLNLPFQMILKMRNVNERTIVLENVLLN